MNKDLFNKFRCVVICLLLATTPAAVAQQSRFVDVYVEGPRPVAKAIYELTKQNYYRVSYEDPRYEYQGDIKDVTEEFRNPLNASPRDPSRRTLIPLGGSIDLRYRSSSLKDEPDDWGEAVRSIVDANQVSASGGRFRVLESGDWLHVIPVETRNSGGEWIKQTSILDAPITVAAQQMTGTAALTMICNALGEVTGQRVLVGVVPMNAFAQHAAELEANSEPARDVLMKLFDSVSDRLSWQIFYTPDDKSYVLNAFTAAPRPETPSPPSEPPRPGVATPPGPVVRQQPSE